MRARMAEQAANRCKLAPTLSQVDKKARLKLKFVPVVVAAKQEARVGYVVVRTCRAEDPTTDDSGRLVIARCCTCEGGLCSVCYPFDCS